MNMKCRAFSSAPSGREGYETDYRGWLTHSRLLARSLRDLRSAYAEQILFAASQAAQIPRPISHSPPGCLEMSVHFSSYGYFTRGVAKVIVRDYRNRTTRLMEVIGHCR